MSRKGGIAAALAACAVVVSAVPTSAAWSDREWVAGRSGPSVGVGALDTVLPVTISQCDFHGGVTANIDVYWQLPAGAWALDNALLYTAPSGGTLTSVGKLKDNSTTVPSGAGYKSTIAFGLLGLGGGVLGTRDLAIVLRAGTWQSTQAVVRVTLVTSLIGSCTVL